MARPSGRDGGQQCRRPRDATGGGGAPPELLSTDDLVRRRELWPIQEAAFRLAVHRSTLYRERDRGRLKIVTIGGRAYVSDRELRRYLDELHREAV